MLVQLLTHTPDPQAVVAAAARLCYSSAAIGDLLALPREDQEKLLAKIMNLGHFSVLEHAVFTFGVEGISRACSHQLVRHRIASFSQQSQRYVSVKTRFETVIPPELEKNPELRERYDTAIEDLHRTYRVLVEAGIAPEDARFVLPNAAATKLMVTMNARELHHFFHLRCCRRAQWEIRALAKEMLRLVRQAAPLLFRTAGPGCLNEACPEGTMTCGQAAEVRREYQSL